MTPKTLALLLGLVCLTGVADSRADMVILKSGEMFETRKAWREGDQVLFYRDGQVARFPAGEVDRLIHAALPDAKPSAAADPPSRPTEPRPLPPGVPGAVPSTAGEAGYRDLSWGMPPSQLTGLSAVGTDPSYGGVSQYVQPEAPRRFGRARVDRVKLGFWQGGLYTIVAEVSNFLDFRELKAEAFRRFGTGRQNQADVERYYWIDADAHRLLDYDFESDTGYLWMRSRRLHERVKAHFPE